MNAILTLLHKEFLQIARNRSMIPIIFVLPFVQLFILSQAANFDIQGLRVAVLDESMSPQSRDLKNALARNGYMRLAPTPRNSAEAFRSIQEAEADIAIHIPADYARDLSRNDASVLLLVNAVDGVKGTLAASWAASIIGSASNGRAALRTPTAEVSVRHWYNPRLVSRVYMMPGILVLLVTMVAAFLTGMNIVREKEIGTIEQLNVTPLKRWHFMVGKLLPFWIIAQMQLVVGLTASVLLFDVPFEGNPAVVFAFSAIYSVAVLSMGLFISTIADTQQQAMFLSWFFLVVFILMSGLFTPIESMPEWSQLLNKINPVAYFIRVIRGVMLKGSSITHLWPEFLSMAIISSVALTGAVSRWRKTSS